MLNPYKENCHNSRTSDDIGMKLGPVIKIDKENQKLSKKKLIMTANYNGIIFFQFIANLEQSGSRIPDA